MKDLNINIGGPTDQARQSVSFQIHNDHRGESFEPERIVTLVRELRASLEAEPLPEDDRRRLERHLTGIEEEARAEQPSLAELRHAVGFVAGLIQSAAIASETVLTIIQSLAACVGLSNAV